MQQKLKGFECNMYSIMKEYLPVVVKIFTLFLCLALVGAENFELYQMHWKSAILNKYLNEEIFMPKPEDVMMSAILNYFVNPSRLPMI